MFTNANEIIKLIETRKNRGYGLAHFHEYMGTLQHPELQLRTIHVAGTNGKGSTVNYIRSILQAAGYKVGTFTSPYMITHLDRIRIQDIYIREDDFVRITNIYYDSWMAWDLSMFEIDMCIAVVYFLEQHVDICVFEVGLGGRLDSTNILYPLVSVITNIGLDHMELLGNTYEKIAEEKAGIIKKGIDVITGEDKAGCLEVFESHATQAGSHCKRVGAIEDVCLLDTITFSYGGYKDVQLASLGAYQSKNAALAIEVIQYLVEKNRISVTEEQLRSGLKNAVWLGRFEIMHEHPRLIVDGAHNAHGIQALADSLESREDIQIIFSVLKDKNFEEMLDILQTVSSHITICHFQNERALDIHDLKQRDGIVLLDDYQQAIQAALQGSKMTLITGSLYFISEVRKYIIELIKEKEGKSL